jgi:hypothetical protein
LALPSVAAFWRAARAVEKVFELDAALEAVVKDVNKRISDLDRRVLQLEADKRELVTEARAAAATAASAVASAHLTELARQVGVMQEQVRRLGDAAAAPARQRPKRIAPPPDHGG